MEPRELNAVEVKTVYKLISKDIETYENLEEGDEIPKPRVHDIFKTFFEEPLENFNVLYQNEDGGFTICIITLRKKNLMWVGAARKSKNDRMNRVRGEMMAFMRAIRHRPLENILYLTLA